MAFQIAHAQAVGLLESEAVSRQFESQAASLMERTRAKLIMTRGKDVSRDRQAKAVFFASLAWRLNFVTDWSIETANVDGKTMRFNPNFVIALEPEERLGVLIHEIMHCSNKHFARMGSRDLSLWNIACDLSINCLIREQGYKLPEFACFPGEGPFKDCPPGLSAEEYYGLIPATLRSAMNQPFQTGWDLTDDPNCCGGVVRPKPQAAKEEQKDGDGSDGDSGKPEESIPQKPGGGRSVLSDSEMKAIETGWEVAVAQAQQCAMRCGNLSAGMDRWIKSVLKPQIDWKSVLRDFVAIQAKNDLNWKRPNRRFIHGGLYLPSRRSMEIGHLVIAIDTSGSIHQRLLDLFASELQSIGEIVERMTIVYHDTGICRVQEWTKDDGDLVLNPKGGGGTDHNCVFSWVEENCEEPPAALIAFTDLMSRFPAEEPADYPVLWVSVYEHAEHPWGSRVDIAI